MALLPLHPLKVIPQFLPFPPFTPQNLPEPSVYFVSGYTGTYHRSTALPHPPAPLAGSSGSDLLIPLLRSSDFFRNTFQTLHITQCKQMEDTGDKTEQQTCILCLSVLFTLYKWDMPKMHAPTKPETQMSPRWTTWFHCSSWLLLLVLVQLLLSEKFSFRKSMFFRRQHMNLKH